MDGNLDKFYSSDDDISDADINNFQLVLSKSQQKKKKPTTKEAYDTRSKFGYKNPSQ